MQLVRSDELSLPEEHATPGGDERRVAFESGKLDHDSAQARVTQFWVGSMFTI